MKNENGQLEFSQTPNVDPRVYDLAETWLGATPKFAALDSPTVQQNLIWQLARELQSACEDFDDRAKLND